MFVNTQKMISITELQKKLTQKIREISQEGEPLFILKNNSLAAVLLSPEFYESLKEMKEVFEHFEIAEIIEKRLKNHDRSKNISWEKLKKKHGL